MPNPATLNIGDHIRLLCVPIGDIQQGDRERRDGVEDAGWTADTIARIIRQDPVVTIDRIDEFGQPWFNYNLVRADGTIEEHTLAVMENDSWVVA